MLFRNENAQENVNSGGRLNDRHHDRDRRHDDRRRSASRGCPRHRRRGGGDRHGSHLLCRMQAIAIVGPRGKIRLR